jgi:hypothetical protein
VGDRARLLVAEIVAPRSLQPAQCGKAGLRGPAAVDARHQRGDQTVAAEQAEKPRCARGDEGRLFAHTHSQRPQIRTPAFESVFQKRRALDVDGFGCGNRIRLGLVGVAVERDLFAIELGYRLHAAAPFLPVVESHVQADPGAGETRRRGVRASQAHVQGATKAPLALVHQHHARPVDDTCQIHARRHAAALHFEDIGEVGVELQDQPQPHRPAREPLDA